MASAMVFLYLFSKILKIMKPHLNVGMFGKSNNFNSVLAAAAIHTRAIRLREVTISALDVIDGSNPQQYIVMVVNLKPEAKVIKADLWGKLLATESKYSYIEKQTDWNHSWPPPRHKKR